MSASRPDRSETIARLESRNNSTCPRRATHCQGWLLCSDGARHADRTASLMSPVSTVVAGMSTSILPARSIRGKPLKVAGPLVLASATIGHVSDV